MSPGLRFLTETLAAPEYNCSAHSPEDWSRLHGEPQTALGVWSIFIGCLSLICLLVCSNVYAIFKFLYTPSMRVFTHEKRFNCVKIMRFLALVDMLGIFCAGILFGIQMLQRAVFCSHKAFILFTCLSGYVAWNTSSLNCIFLVLNRILELTGKYNLFKGAPGTSIMLASLIYGIANALFTPPFLTNSKYQTILVCPLIPGFECDQYVNYVHHIHNSVVIVAILSLFIILCSIIGSSTMHLNKSLTTKNLQAKIFTQATIICVLNVGGAFVFIIMYYIPTPQVVLTIGMIGYQLNHASPCAIYLALNPTVRQELMTIMGLQRYTNKISSTQVSGMTTSIA